MVQGGMQATHGAVSGPKIGVHRNAGEPGARRWVVGDEEQVVTCAAERTRHAVDHAVSANDAESLG